MIRHGYDIARWRRWRLRLGGRHEIRANPKGDVPAGKILDDGMICRPTCRHAVACSLDRLDVLAIVGPFLDAELHELERVGVFVSAHKKRPGRWLATEAAAGARHVVRNDLVLCPLPELLQLKANGHPAWLALELQPLPSVDKRRLERHIENDGPVFHPLTIRWEQIVNN